MKKRVYITMCTWLIMCFHGPLSWAAGNRLVIGISAPPAILLVEDDMGRKSGVDSASILDEVGMGGIKIRGIPEAIVEDVNISGDDNLGDERTRWYVELYELSGRKEYIIHLFGKSNGVGELTLHATIETSGGTDRDIIRKEQFLFSDGVNRDLRVIVDTIDHSLDIKRISTTNDVDSTIAMACMQGLIVNQGICQSFRMKLSAIGKSISVGNKASVDGQINAFINELNALGGKKIHEPALSLLVSEISGLKNSMITTVITIPPVKQKPWWWPF